MKPLWYLLLLSFCLPCFGQGMNVTVARSTKGIYIESEGSYLLSPAIRISPAAGQQLAAGIRKTKEWYTLNQTHHKEFQKEITRFWYTNKETFQFHGYVQAFAGTFKLIFIGHADGYSSCLMKLESHGSTNNYFEFSTLQELDRFLKVLQGQSARKEIDAIFK